MKRINGVSMAFLAFTLFLSACNQALTAEEVVAEVDENKEMVENYNAVIDLDLTVTDTEQETTLMETETSMDVAINELTLDTYGTITASGGLTGDIAQEYYSIGDEAYINLNGGGWEDVSSQKETLFQNTETFYTTLIPILEALSAEGEMTENDEQYIFSFQGNSQALFDAFEGPYSVDFGVVPTDQIEHDAAILINKETLFIDQLTNDMTGMEDGGVEIFISIAHSYDSINGIQDELVIPQEVIDAAN